MSDKDVVKITDYAFDKSFSVLYVMKSLPTFLAISIPYLPVTWMNDCFVSAKQKQVFDSLHDWFGFLWTLNLTN